MSAIKKSKALVRGETEQGLRCGVNNMNNDIQKITPDATGVNNQKIWTLFDKDIFELFVKPGEIIEVRILNAKGKSPLWGNEYARGKGTISGYFDSYEAFTGACKSINKATYSGVYYTLQVIDPRLIGRAYNRLKPSDLTTSDRDVIAYRWLPIDADPNRPAGIASSDSELQAAMGLIEEVAFWVVHNMNLPAPIKAMSGNGAHLLFRLPDLPADDLNKSFVQNTLNGIADRFDNDMVSIDRSVYNPGRIWKLYGTTARKGDPVPANQYRAPRSHRMSYIFDMGDC